MRCSRCGSLNSADAAFCGECGVAIRGQNGVAPPTPAAIIQPRQSSLSDSDSTRYLCAAVHLDSVLAERLIREILDEEYKASPPSPDVDLVPVLRNALSARQRHLVRDVAISFLFFVFLGLAFAYSLPGALIDCIHLARHLAGKAGCYLRCLGLTGPGHSARRCAVATSEFRAERRLSHIAQTPGVAVTFLSTAPTGRSSGAACHWTRGHSRSTSSELLKGGRSSHSRPRRSMTLFSLSCAALRSPV